MADATPDTPDLEPEGSTRGMRRSSKILLALCVVLAIVLAAVYIPLINASQPDFTSKDAVAMLNGLSDALARKNEGDVLAYAAPDAVIAGRRLKEIRQYLRQAFGVVKDLQVRFQDVALTRVGDTVTVDANVVAGEGQSSGPLTVTYYQSPVRFALKRLAYSHLLGLFRTYDWKVVSVEAREFPGAPGP